MAARKLMPIEEKPIARKQPIQIGAVPFELDLDLFIAAGCEEKKEICFELSEACLMDAIQFDALILHQPQYYVSDNYIQRALKFAKLVNAKHCAWGDRFLLDNVSVFCKLLPIEWYKTRSHIIGRLFRNEYTSFDDLLKSFHDPYYEADPDGLRNFLAFLVRKDIIESSELGYKLPKRR